MLVLFTVIVSHVCLTLLLLQALAELIYGEKINMPWNNQGGDQGGPWGQGGGQGGAEVEVVAVATRGDRAAVVRNLPTDCFVRGVMLYAVLCPAVRDREIIILLLSSFLVFGRQQVFTG